MLVAWRLLCVYLTQLWEYLLTFTSPAAKLLDGRVISIPYHYRGYWYVINVPYSSEYLDTSVRGINYNNMYVDETRSHPCVMQPLL